MKLILKREVDNLGLPGDVVEVADGYGRNYLLPRGYAIIATKGAMREAEALLRSRKVREAETLGEATAAKDALEARTLRITARVDERGHLYGSVSAQDVAAVLKQRGHDIPRKRIELKGSIKEIGTYELPVHVHPQVTATVTVEVLDEEGKVIRDASGLHVEGQEEPPPIGEDHLKEAALAEADKLEATEVEQAAADEAADAADAATDEPEA